jgi:hypothetical protein
MAQNMGISERAKQRIQDKLLARRARYHDTAPVAREEAQGWNVIAKVATGEDQRQAFADAKRAANTANRAATRETTSDNLLKVVADL